MSGEACSDARRTLRASLYVIVVASSLACSGRHRVECVAHFRTTEGVEIHTWWTKSESTRISLNVVQPKGWPRTRHEDIGVLAVRLDDTIETLQPRFATGVLTEITGATTNIAVTDFHSEESLPSYKELRVRLFGRTYSASLRPFGAVLHD